MRATVAAALLLVTARGDLPRYAVEPGTELVRRYESRTELESEPMRMYLDGEEVPSAGHGEMRLKVESSRQLEITDVIEAVRAGGPARFVRTLDEADDRSKETSTFHPPEGEEQSKETERKRTSALVGRKVRFTWDEEREEHRAAFAEGDDDAELLEGLVADLDWLAILPAKAVEVDAEWKIDPKLLIRIQQPGGKLHLRVEDAEPDEASEAFHQQLDDSLAGEAKVIWRGVREEDGRKLGVLRLEAEVHTEARAETESPRGAREAKVAFDYEGELLWDMAGGHLAGYAIEARIEAVFATERPAKGASGDRVLRQVFELAGKVRNELEVEVTKG